MTDEFRARLEVYLRSIVQAGGDNSRPWLVGHAEELLEELAAPAARRAATASALYAAVDAADTLVDRICGVYAPDTPTARKGVAIVLEEAYAAGVQLAREKFGERKA